MADMVVTPARAGLTPTQWDSEFFLEYVRKNQFSRYFGTEPTAMIQIREDLTRKPGDTIVFPAVRRLTGAGVTGNTVLEGNEEVLNARSMTLSVGVIRHGVAVSEWDEQKSVIDLRNAARSALMTWELEKIRSDIISSLFAITADANVTYTYSAATAGQRNTWVTNNADRLLFGNAISNGSSNVMATALATINNSSPGGKMSASVLSLAKRRARLASPRIRPISVNNDEEWYVVLMGSLQFRDLMADTTIINALQYGWDRGRDNPLFTAGDILWNGMIIREVPELSTLNIAGAGAAGIDVSPYFVCGAQALGIAWAQRLKSTTNVRDYDFFHGVGIQEIRGIGKLRFGTDATTDTTAPKDAGIVTGFAANVGDA
jgi:N4-gp56 family major capsid protein